MIDPTFKPVFTWQLRSVALSRSGIKRQRYGENRSSIFAFHTDGTSGFFYDPFRDGQTKTGSLPGGFCCEEGLEQIGHDFRCDALPGISDADDRIVRILPGTHLYGTGFPDMIQGILEDVG
jgi:hypothetical protein